MTKEEYHRIVEDYDQHLINLAIDAIPLNINRAGKHYKKLVYETQQSMERDRRTPRRR
jgi:hypothetical protein